MERKCLMTLSEYEELKGKIPSKKDAFRLGQVVAVAYFADCLEYSVAFPGMEKILQKIESSREIVKKDEMKSREWL